MKSRNSWIVTIVTLILLGIAGIKVSPYCLDAMMFGKMAAERERVPGARFPGVRIRQEACSPGERVLKPIGIRIADLDES